MTEVIADSARAAELRGRLTDELVADGTIVSNQVEAAFRTEPRHLFSPGATLEESYAQDIVATKRDEHGITISSVSAPRIQAFMLEQAGLHPGMRVLEIGSGGYHAALMAELVGADGEVTTVDIDPEVVDRARSCLTDAGYSRVNVVLADAEGGVPEHAPYDRIIVTVGAWDIPPAWVDQLTEGGTITVPFALIQQALMDGREEIVLTETVIRALTAGDPAEMLPPPRTELAFQLYAASPKAVARGAFRLVVTAAPRPGSSMAGRFADLLPDAERERLAESYAALGTDDPDAIAAQLSFPPRRRHSENVV
ncbi:MAG: lantibiotic dehydratase, partial [Pseudonocardiaceae bacterium]